MSTTAAGTSGQADEARRRGGFSSLSDIDEVPGFPEYVREDLKRRVSL